MRQSATFGFEITSHDANPDVASGMVVVADNSSFQNPTVTADDPNVIMDFGQTTTYTLSITNESNGGQDYSISVVSSNTNLVTVQSVSPSSLSLSAYQSGQVQVTLRTASSGPPLNDPVSVTLTADDTGGSGIDSDAMEVLVGDYQ